MITEGYFAVKNVAAALPVSSILGEGTIAFWLVEVTPIGMCKHVIYAMDASHALSIASMYAGTPVVRFDTLPDGNLKVEFLNNNVSEWYLLTGWN